ncbi:ribosomal protein RPS12 [Toxoplasma gondii TgCatPRC2]|uniref:40S ribosomal protein S12 n=15 Tax=Toxoplasma gondii TaxID=5811 RepID=B9Q056_TOXGV|nr:ribosomal protein RPS12 [Toxoplasma gondii ME49]5XXU_M Chain M, Ribosomal protein eS12 [Toxoplasma gondii]EPR61426.1 ribosomal protein RPS12 [Toxoplasma gondii GT1]ESS33231.1 ribosomal protein RPS12 [Toxoplasma gondii VEG]KFG33669.1 ribosomal protein RPS12 [Toxoplasma gondii p89]KFG36805.1 ribosomal protein RPS12 [Toxoplasma gondii FOU]KFG38234.1 ribosomal protein RPS12 [Toxoplasma gondii GAB2-2007-GAL-DOM2]KFG59150.1 ribosomal protein RPS12 [Toxoplasma gondii RUB]KFH00477.1 ribosomal pr|eukprot:XP_008887460.1 ribosomal protein RPS12 [Hammondia hammondi]
MSDVESVADEVVAPVEEEEEVKDLMTAIRKVLKNALIHDGLVRGLHEVAKALDAKKAQVCFLSESCSEPAYKKLVQGLCKEHGIPLLDVTDSKELGEWAGLCKVDKDGTARKVVGASCVCVTDFGEESEALTFLQNHIKTLS